jgi:hypothetical protein
MTKLKLCFTGALVVASLAVPLATEYQARLTLQAQDERLRQRKDEWARLAADNQRLARLLAQAGSAPAFSTDQFRELLRLRGQVGRLRMESRLLAQALNAGTPPGSGTWADREEMYAERINQLKQWLGEHPGEKIPELQFLTDQDWLDAAPAAEDGFDAAMSLLRANAGMRVTNRFFGALRRYGSDHDGQFPAEVAQLKPYLDPPVDDDILDRYVILPSTNLVPELRCDGDWVITEKAPVNEALDMRSATGLTKGRFAGPGVGNRWQLLH